MSPARATSSAVERWIPWRGRGRRRRNGGRERKGEKEGGGKRKGREGEEEKREHSHETMKKNKKHKAMVVTFGSCFPFPVRTKRGRENGWLSERLDVDLLLSVSSLLTGSPILGSKVNSNINCSFC